MDPVIRLLLAGALQPHSYSVHLFFYPSKLFLEVALFVLPSAAQQNDNDNRCSNKNQLASETSPSLPPPPPALLPDGSIDPSDVISRDAVSSKRMKNWSIHVMLKCTISVCCTE